MGSNECAFKRGCVWRGILEYFQLSISLSNRNALQELKSDDKAFFMNSKPLAKLSSCEITQS